MTKIYFFDCVADATKARITNGILSDLWNTHHSYGYKWHYWFDCHTVENMGKNPSTVKIGNLYRALYVDGENITPWKYMAIMVLKMEDDG